MKNIQLILSNSPVAASTTVNLSIEQRGFVLSPRQYKKVLKKMSEIRDLLAQKPLNTSRQQFVKETKAREKMYQQDVAADNRLRRLYPDLSPEVFQVQLHTDAQSPEDNL